VQRIFRAVEDRHDYFNIELVDGYAEPGYTDPPCGIVAFSNWNTKTQWDNKRDCAVNVGNTMPRVAALFEKLGVECEWSDEWTVCSSCGKAVRTSANSYRWKQSYWMDDDGDVLCQDCILEDPKDYLKAHEGVHTHCVTIDIDLKKQGYRLLESGLEHGLCGHQAADPEIIATSLRNFGVNRFLFSLDSAGQFDIAFSVWIHKSERVRRKLWEQAAKCGEDPAVMMQRALADASRKMPSGPGIHVAKCHGDGTATVKTVSAQDFFEGNALA
jgi:hypothetical protein